LKKLRRRSDPKRARLSSKAKPEATGRLGIDEIDLRILGALQNDCRARLESIAKELGIPKSTVHYRIRRLEETGVIERYSAKVNAAKLGKDYLVVVLVRAKYGPRYHQRIGKRIAAIRGVWAVYYVLGDNDFVLLIRADDREDYMRTLEKISSMPDIERTSTQVVATVIKEDPRITIT
jgi:Lrp/AsnC family leucine-responsive transcriptional regulator